MTAVWFPAEQPGLWHKISGDGDSLKAPISQPKPSSAHCVALPCSCFISIPLWLPVGADHLIRELVSAQLEKIGVWARDSTDTVWDWRSLRKDGERQLVTAWVLKDQPAAIAGLEDAGSFIPSAALVPSEDKAWTFWREHGHLSVAWKDSGSILYFQRLSAERLTPEVVTEAICTALALQMEQVADTAGGALLAGDFAPEEMEAAKTGFGEVRLVARDIAHDSAHRLPTLLPPRLKALKDSRQHRAHLGRVAAALGSLYLLSLLAWCGWVWWELRESSAATANAAELNRIAEPLRQVAQAWDEMEGALDFHKQPAELLLTCAKILPAQTSRLTAFEIEKNGTAIRLSGETTDGQSAFHYLEALKATPETALYRWEMQQPRSLPSGRWQFQISGGNPRGTQ